MSTTARYWLAVAAFIAVAAGAALLFVLQSEENRRLRPPGSGGECQDPAVGQFCEPPEGDPVP